MSEHIEALGCKCAPLDDGTWVGHAASRTRVIVRAYEEPAAYSVALWSGDVCLASAEAPTLRDAERKCAMRAAFVADAVRQVLTRFDEQEAA